MNVRDLITELLDCDLDAEVGVIVQAESNTLDESDFFIEESSFAKRNYVSFVVEPRNEDLINVNELQDLKDQINELEEKQND